MRSMLCVAALAATPAAYADFVQVHAEGTFEILEVHPDQINILFDCAVVSQIGGLGLTSVNGEATHQFTGDPDVMFGSGQLVGDTPDDILVYMFDALAIAGDVTTTFEGTWDVPGGFGDFKGFTGAGTLSGFYSFTSQNAGDFVITFEGDVVPAPAALTLLAPLAFARRRRCSN